MLTYRNDDDKYIYLPKALTGKNGQEGDTLRREFAEFAVNEMHGEYDRGFFKALEDYLSLLAKTSPTPEVTQAKPMDESPDGVQQKLTPEQKEAC